MKSSKKLALGVALACAAWGATTAMAATDAEIQTAIDNGLTYLSGQQQAGGNWIYGGGTYNQAVTGASAYAMLTQYSHWADTGNVASV